MDANIQFIIGFLELPNYSSGDVISIIRYPLSRKKLPDYEKPNEHTGIFAKYLFIYCMYSSYSDFFPCFKICACANWLTTMKEWLETPEVYNLMCRLDLWIRLKQQKYWTLRHVLEEKSDYLTNLCKLHFVFCLFFPRYRIIEVHVNIFIPVTGIFVLYHVSVIFWSLKKRSKDVRCSGNVASQ